MAKPQINLPPSEIWGDLGLGRGSRLYNFHAYNYLQRELPTTSTFTERLAQPRARFPGVNVSSRSSGIVLGKAECC